MRRKSRVTKQHSYDEESSGGGGGQSGHPDTGLGLPVQLPRRASAYDVYATPGSGGLNAMAIAAAQQRASISNQGEYQPGKKKTKKNLGYNHLQGFLLNEHPTIGQRHVGSRRSNYHHPQSRKINFIRSSIVTPRSIHSPVNSSLPESVHPITLAHVPILSIIFKFNLSFK